MSMSQEEIEALMNGLDIVEDETSTEEKVPEVQKESSVVNTDEIEELISQNEEIKTADETKTPEPEIFKSETLEDDLESSSSDIVDNNDIDALLKDLESDSSTDDEIHNTDDSNSDNIPKKFDDVSADAEGIVESKSKVPEEVIVNDDSKDEEPNNNEEIGKDWADSRIDKGIFPLPADNDTKVVNQLNQVANDSEEKVSQIFDVLSLTLDNNTEIRNKLKDLEAYILAQQELLNSLNKKFPNIEVFNTQKESSNLMATNLKDMNTIVNEEDMKIFEAMELMQFNDINRQKIERVMSVIKKLSSYLNNLFEDDGSRQEVAVAKHIHGDTDHDLIGEDLDKLINEYNK